MVKESIGFEMCFDGVRMLIENFFFMLKDLKDVVLLYCFE